MRIAIAAMNVIHRETRVSVIFLLACLICQGLVLLFAFQKVLPFAATVGFSIGILIIFLMLFSYQVTINEESLFISYGIGLIGREIPLSIVATTEIVPNTSLTWIYDPFVSNVLRLTLRGGGSAIIGIGDPKQLQQLMRQIIRD